MGGEWGCPPQRAVGGKVEVVGTRAVPIPASAMSRPLQNVGFFSGSQCAGAFAHKGLMTAFKSRPSLALALSLQAGPQKELSWAQSCILRWGGHTSLGMASLTLDSRPLCALSRSLHILGLGSL